jgi:hypothetical protein
MTARIEPKTYLNLVVLAGEVVFAAPGSVWLTLGPEALPDSEGSIHVELDGDTEGLTSSQLYAGQLVRVMARVYQGGRGLSLLATDVEAQIEGSQT